MITATAIAIVATDPSASAYGTFLGWHRPPTIATNPTTARGVFSAGLRGLDMSMRELGLMWTSTGGRSTESNILL